MNLKDQALFTANALENAAKHLTDTIHDYPSSVSVSTQLMVHASDLRKAAESERDPSIHQRPVFQHPPASEVLSKYLRLNPYDRDERELHQIIGLFVAEAQRPLMELLTTITSRIQMPWEQAGGVARAAGEEPK